MCAMKRTGDNDQMPVRPAARRDAPVIWLWLLVLAAWTLALLAVLTRQSYLIDHHYLLEESHLPMMAALVVFLVSWQVLTVGMMLPSSMPIVSMLVRASSNQRYPSTIQLTFLAGYTVVWTGFALVAFLGDSQIHQLVHSWFWLYLHSWLIGAATLAIAGGFQFSPLKAYFLMRCRSLFSFYHKGVRGAWHMGLNYGICCLGSCWALMLIMFGLGVESLVTMAALTGVMVVEKTFPGGQHLSPVIGIVLLLLAAVWLVHPAWLSAAGV